MGGRGSSSTSARSTSDIDYSRGEGIAKELGVSAEKGAEMFDAINRWADGSSGIKSAQKGTGTYTNQNIKDAATLDEFIDKAPGYSGELIRVMNIKDYKKPRKNGKIISDNTITSWSVPGNYVNLLNEFGSGSGDTVVYHVKASKGADTRKYSWLRNHDAEIIQARGYDGALDVLKVQTKTERTQEYPEGRKVTHVYLTE